MEVHHSMNIGSKIRTGREAGRPVYREIEQYFSDLIVRHELAPGDRLPSLDKVAASTGINKRTVMQAYQCLAGRGLIEMRHGKGSFVTDPREGVRVVSIGLVGWDYEALHALGGHHYVQGVYASISEEATNRKIDCRWIKMTTGLIEECQKKNVSGCILMGTEQSSHLLKESLIQGRLKAVTIGGCDHQTTPLVHGDDVQGTQLLMDHLLSMGHRRIAIFYGSSGNYSAQRRLGVYQNKMSQADFYIHPSWICDDSRFASNSGALDQLLESWFNSTRPPTAIIAAGGHSALATLQTLSRHGIRVPEDVSICGYDDFPGIQEFATPSLTVVRQPIVEIGRTAVRNLIALLGGEQVGHAVLPVELVVRESTAKAKG